MTEILFYHLERQPLERVLPLLLEKTLQRGWRAVVQADSEERIEALDAWLWTYREDSFLPHGTVKQGDSELQPVYLTSSSDRPNEANVRFFVDGARPQEEDIGQYERVVFLFDGSDEVLLEAARDNWRSVRAAGHDATYWQQDEGGAWVKKG